MEGMRDRIIFKEKVLIYYSWKYFRYKWFYECIVPCWNITRFYKKVVSIKTGGATWISFRLDKYDVYFPLFWGLKDYVVK